MTWKTALAAALDARIVAATLVSGGDINDAYRVELERGGLVFVKTHADPPPGMYLAEAAGLAWLRDGPLRVPQVVAAGDRFLALEWLELADKGPRFDEELGRGLAALHRLGASSFGTAPIAPTYLATIPQPTTTSSDLAEHWIEHRVRPLTRRACELGRMPDVDAQLDALRARTERFGPAEPPARLHGDLWWGNVVAVDGSPVLIDPAAYGGHREVDLAMLALFGGVSLRLVAAYEEAAPLAAGWRDRVALWQLYPLAAHAVLFGGAYGGEVATTLDRLL